MLTSQNFARSIRCKKTRDFARFAMERGWQVSITNGGHLKFVSPTGTVLFTSSTPSDWRAWKNFRSQLRRQGLDV
jgi:hypothetical protein